MISYKRLTHIKSDVVDVFIDNCFFNQHNVGSNPFSK